MTTSALPGCLFQDKIKDKLGLAEMQAGLLLRVGRKAEAEAAYRRLLAVNPNNYRMHHELQAAMGLVAKPGAVTTNEAHRGSKKNFLGCLSFGRST